MWRDLGHVAGAPLAGILTDAIGVATAINVIGALTFASGLLVWSRFEKR
jgi:predicted MFS family arabinose efflux permease